MNEIIITTVILIFCVVIGVPIASAMGITAIAFIVITDPGNLTAIPLRFFAGMNSFTLMALPLFMLAAEIMVKSGISARLFDFVRMGRIGRARGGLAYVNILASVIFGSISGAALSDVAGLGKIELDAMNDDGYPKDFSCAITGASSIESPLIPPSNIAILYAGTMSLSVGAVLYAGVIPGLILAGTQMLYVALNAKRLNLPKHAKKYEKHERNLILRDGLIALGMPLIILVGITTGWFTPTEAAAVAVLYSLIVGKFVFHKITLQDIKHALWSSAKTTGNLFMIIGFSNVFGWALGTEQIPQKLAGFMTSITDNKYIIMLIINIIFLIVGMWMETASAVLLFVPILAPVAYAVGVNPIQFAVVVIVNLTIGLVTPPVGVVLYAVADVAKEKFEKVVKATMPFVVLALVTLILMTLIPELTLFVPRLLGFI